MRRPSIVFVNRAYPPARGATGRLLRDLARSFAREGWQVTVICGGSEKGRDRDGSVRLIRLKSAERPGFFAYMWLWVRMLITALREPSANLVVTTRDPPLGAVMGRIIKNIKKSRHINWCHDLYPDVLPVLGYNLPGFLYKRLWNMQRKSMREADRVIVIGRCMARLLAVEGMDPKAITVIPNWPDFELSKSSTIPGSHEPLTHSETYINGPKPPEAQISSGPRFRVLYAGNIGRAHPLETILDAAAILNTRASDIEFVFVGDGPGFDLLARERARRDLENVRLLPYQPLTRLRQLMESGDIHIASLQQEAAGMIVPSKIYAALAVGRPCVLVGPAKTETAKVLEDFAAGYIVPQGEAQKLADIIYSLRHDEKKWFAAHNGAQEAGQVFVPKESINAWIERAWSVVQRDMKLGKDYGQPD